MKNLAMFVRLAITPLFVALAIFNFQIEHSASLAPGGHAAMGHATMGHASADAARSSMVKIFASMWLMYALMGLAHVTPWFSLLGGKEKAAPADY